MSCTLFTLLHRFDSRPLADDGAEVAQARYDFGSLPLRPSFLGRAATVALLSSDQPSILTDTLSPAAERVGHLTFVFAGTVPGPDCIPKHARVSYVGPLLGYPDSYRLAGRTSGLLRGAKYLGLFCLPEDVEKGYFDARHALPRQAARLHRLHTEYQTHPLAADPGWRGLGFETGEEFYVHESLMDRFSQDECLDLAFQTVSNFGGDLEDNRPHRWVDVDLPGKQTVAILFRLVDGHFRLHMGYRDVLVAGGYTPPAEAYPVTREESLPVYERPQNSARGDK